MTKCKALIEMSSDRADFVSRLFSRPRPAGLDSKSTAEDLFAAVGEAEADPTLFLTNLQAIRKQLGEHHGFKLSSEDEASLDWQSRIAPAAEVMDRFGVAGMKHAMDLNGYYGGPPRLPWSAPAAFGRFMATRRSRFAGLR